MFSILLLLAILTLTFVYLRGKYNEHYWTKRGVAFYGKNKALGIFWDFLNTDKAVFEILSEIYAKHENDPAVGVGSLTAPTLYVIDPQNVQHVMQNDHPSFNHRGVTVNKDDLLADNVLFMNGARWKLMRQKMTPLFTAAKLKNMFYIIDKSAQDFVDYLKENPSKLKGKGFDTVNEFCSAAVAAAVFGISTESTFKSPFLKMAREANKVTWKTNLKFAIASVSGTLTRLLGIQLFKEHEALFIGAIKQVLRSREKEGIKRHDFGDICVSLQKAGTMQDPESGLELEPTDELLAAQGFFFFIAGVETAASAMFGTLTELGKRPDILKKLQKEIDETYEKHIRKITYDVISEMKYLDQVLSEALRLHTPVGFITRMCVNDSILPVGNIKVSKGTLLYIPVFDMHFNPKYFPNPEEFDPERFSPENRGKSDVAYLPFGRGARVCIGMRYAKLQVMAGLFHVLRHYEVMSHVDLTKKRYAKGQFQMRRIDTDIELIPRNSNKDPLHDCSVTNCRFLIDDTLPSPLDAVVVPLREGVPNISDLNRQPHQRWIFWTDESPFNIFEKNRGLHHLANVFNWSMTYRSDSDIPVPYGRTIPLQYPKLNKITNREVKKLVPYWNRKQKDILVTIMMSRCVSFRMHFVQQLRRFLNVDFYGQCSTLPHLKYRCPGHFKKDCPIISKYLFYLVIENSQCRQYLTEKIFHNAYSKGAIPIIMGTPLVDCIRLLPPNSFIHMDDFDSVKQLARYIYSVSSNLTKIMSYHTWRNHFKVVEEHGFLGTKSLSLCRLCEALNYNSKNKKVYRLSDILLYLDINVGCFRNVTGEKERKGLEWFLKTNFP